MENNGVRILTFEFQNRFDLKCPLKLRLSSCIWITIQQYNTSHEIPEIKGKTKPGFLNKIIITPDIYVWYDFLF